MLYEILSSTQPTVLISFLQYVEDLYKDEEEEKEEKMKKKMMKKKRPAVVVVVVFLFVHYRLLFDDKLQSHLF